MGRALDGDIEADSPKRPMISGEPPEDVLKQNHNDIVLYCKHHTNVIHYIYIISSQYSPRFIPHDV